MWKESGLGGIGLGAEDVAKIEPRFTFKNGNGEVEGVKYGELNAVLINAIKEQQKKYRPQASADKCFDEADPSLYAEDEGSKTKNR